MKYELIIIGSGPAGYVAAIRAGQLGIKTAIIEKGEIGGTCLNRGCIPSKAMIESAKLYQKVLQDGEKFGIAGLNKEKIHFDYEKALKRSETIIRRLTKGVEFLIKKNNIEIITGEAKITGKNSVSVNNRMLECNHIIIATGSKFLPVKDEKLQEKCVDANNFFKEKKLPENIVVLGGTPPPVEIAQMLAMIGKNVTLAILEDIVMPLSDDYMRNYMTKILEKNNIKIINHVNSDEIEIIDDKTLKIKGEEVACDMIYNLENRKGIIPENTVNIEIEDGFIKTNDNLQTNVDNIYAVGDVNGKSRFAHIASAEGIFVVNSLKGIKEKLEFEKYPLNMYTHPESAQIGKTEQQLKAEGVEYKIGEFPLTANGKALAEGSNDGFVRILSDKKYGEVLGVQIVSDHATDLISEASVLMQLESTIYDLAKIVHPHPTISEAFTEAGLDGLDGGTAIHK